MDGTGMGWDKIGQYLVALLTALGGLKVFQFLKNWGTDSRKERASAEDSELEVLRKHNAWLSEQNRELAKTNEKHREDKMKLWDRIITIQEALAEAERHQCLVPDDECLRRQPQDVKCRLRELLKGEYTKEHPNAIIDEEDMMTPLPEKEEEEDSDESDGIP